MNVALKINLSSYRRFNLVFPALRFINLCGAVFVLLHACFHILPGRYNVGGLSSLTTNIVDSLTGLNHNVPWYVDFVVRD